jgi:DNA-binding transcriptional regulator YiaG
MTPAAAIRAIRAAAGLSQRQLAERIGAAQPNVAQWERGITRPDGTSTARLSAVADDGGAALLAALRATDNGTAPAAG